MYTVKSDIPTAHLAKAWDTMIALLISNLDVGGLEFAMKRVMILMCLFFLVLLFSEFNFTNTLSQMLSFHVMYFLIISFDLHSIDGRKNRPTDKTKEFQSYDWLEADRVYCLCDL